MKYEIIKFGKPFCQPCISVDTFLKAQGVEYKTINPFEPETEEDEDLVLSLGIKVVPITILRDENKNIVLKKAGFNEKALSHLIEEYKNGN